MQTASFSIINIPAKSPHRDYLSTVSKRDLKHFSKVDVLGFAGIVFIIYDT